MLITKYKKEIGFAGLIIATFLLGYLGNYFHIGQEELQKALGKFPLLYGSILFVLLYVIVTFFIWLSKDAFFLVGAVLFGAYLSALLISVSEVINAFILFYLSRNLGRAYLDQSLSGRYKKLDEKLGKINFFWLFIFRAAPLVPYRFLDLAAGLSRISFRKYLAAVVLGSPLKILWIQYILCGVGSNIFNPYALYEYFLSNKALWIFSIVYFVLVVMVIFKIKSRS